MLRNLKNSWFQAFKLNLSPSEATDYPSCKVTKSVNQHIAPITIMLKAAGSWPESCSIKAELFGHHFRIVFPPNSNDVTFDNSQGVEEYTGSSNQLSLPITYFKLPDVKRVGICELNSEKAPGYDII